MKRNALFVLFLFVAGVSLFLQMNHGISVESVAVTQPTDTAGEVEAAIAKIDPVPASPVSVQTDTNSVSQTAPLILKNAILLEEKAEEKNGQIVRKYLYSTDFKYPVVQVEETFSKTATGQETLLCRDMMVGDHVMVRFPADLSSAEIEAWAERQGYTIRKKLQTTDIYLIQTSIHELDAIYQIMAGFNEAFPLETRGKFVAEPDYLRFAVAVPNDERFSYQWAMNNNGSIWGSVVDEDIDAPEAWDIATGSHDVTVAVIDTGVCLTHEDLADNIWTNPNENPDDQIDNDNNSYTNDIHGWDFYADDNDPTEEAVWLGHGTHCAGIIGAVGNNGIGVAGVSWNVSLIPVRALGPTGGATLSDLIAAVNYATQLGVDVISASWGGSGFSYEMENAIQEAGASNILFVAAAGNDGTNNDLEPKYPACFDLDNIISVGASTAWGELASYSNYGTNTVDLIAPGGQMPSPLPPVGWINALDIYSTLFVVTLPYGPMRGTSMACPHVSGAAALIKSISPDATVAEIKQAILDGVDPSTNFAGKCVTGGRLNVYQALLKTRPAISSINLSITEADEGDGVLTNAGTILLEQAYTNDISIELFSSDTSEALVPSNVVITAGQTSGVFNVEIVDDGLLDGSKDVVIAAIGLEWPYKNSIVVHDNESAVLSLTLPAETTEGNGSTNATVTVSLAPDDDVLVSLESSTNEVSLPDSVVISNGQTSATFKLQAVNDNWIDGDQTVTITAHVENWTDGSESIVVHDNNLNPVLHIYTWSSLKMLFEGDGVVTTQAVVFSLGGVPVTNTPISLTSSDTSELVVTDSVVIPAGQSYAYFDITVVEDSIYDGVQSNITVEASASGFGSGTNSPDTINVYDSIHHFQVLPEAGPHVAGTPFALKVTARSWDDFPAPVAGTVTVSSLADSGPIPVVPALLTGFEDETWPDSESSVWPDAQWSNSVALYGDGTNVILTVNDGFGHSGTSTPFNVVLPVLSQTVSSYYPEWWRIQGVTESDPLSTNDYVAINQGQLKHTAAQAYAEFANRLTGLDLSAISNMVSSFSGSNNYSAVNLGQLKYVVQPFYDVLWTNGITNAWPDGMTSGPYPWSEQSGSEQNQAIANQGQLKYVFSFDLDYDSDGDGISDHYEDLYGLDLNNALDAFLDPDGDMVPNLYEYRNGRTDPTDAQSFPSADAHVSTTPTNGAVSSITEAVSNAVAGSDTGYPIVLIEPGTYTFTNEVVLDVPNILIYATNHTAAVDGNGTSRCFLINSGSPVLSGLVLQNGSTVGYGGAVFVDQGVELALLRNCIITNCEAAVCSGGAVNVEGESAALLLNCVLAGNTAAYGGAACADPNADLQMINCTVINNHATVNGGGVRYSTLKNSLIWGNSADSQNPQLENVSVSYCCIENWSGSETGITTNDPSLVSNSWYLASTNSSCYNAGTSTNAVMIDIDGEFRNGTIDIGADEL